MIIPPPRALLTLALLCAPCTGYTVLTTPHRAAAATRRACAITALEPVTTTAAAAFAACLVPPSLLLAGKQGEINAARAEADVAKEELERLKGGFHALMCAYRPTPHASSPCALTC